MPRAVRCSLVWGLPGCQHEGRISGSQYRDSYDMNHRRQGRGDVQSRAKAWQSAYVFHAQRCLQTWSSVGTASLILLISASRTVKVTWFSACEYSERANLSPLNTSRLPSRVSRVIFPVHVSAGTAGICWELCWSIKRKSSGTSLYNRLSSLSSINPIKSIM